MARPGESKAKSDLGNLREDEQEQFKKAAKAILALSDDQIRQLIENGQFEEVKKDG
ncbi:type II toxin-antitoxin system RelE/ParE family toxin [Spiribacter salilacus]|uniref:type II toxin-antitoxin system RelE/ParE family toxin n=1 Tax=Spiribacter salilacus TaxID=2664894 RepID=UPI001561F0AD|nr:type II toxin-antitoxin system RelE/ParE family toxin [Spiribacter salilacus]